ncbi:hypothetical protein RB2083_3009 [Rhodobacteraceae bacterium HTCC2083]|jgi:hypothetical protein|nr:hypothetical protein RB2083_3009 [Rhodobacteraceae bacterium HTCC2083]
MEICPFFIGRISYGPYTITQCRVFRRPRKARFDDQLRMVFSGFRLVAFDRLQIETIGGEPVDMHTVAFFMHHT